MRYSLRTNRKLAFAAFALVGFGITGWEAAFAQNDVANTIAKAANYIFSTDFVHDPVADTFSEDELRVLEDNPDALNSMIEDAIGLQHSVGGAMLMAHFGLKEHFDYLRHRLLQPGRTYGWEGTYTSDEERFYSDHQYVFHSKYVQAVEELTGKPLHEAIDLTDRERQRIDRLAANPEHESYHWAVWMSRKLGL